MHSYHTSSVHMIITDYMHSYLTWCMMQDASHLFSDHAHVCDLWYVSLGVVTYHAWFSDLDLGHGCCTRSLVSHIALTLTSLDISWHHSTFPDVARHHLTSSDIPWHQLTHPASHLTLGIQCDAWPWHTVGCKVNEKPLLLLLAVALKSTGCHSLEPRASRPIGVLWDGLTWCCLMDGTV